MVLFPFRLHNNLIRSLVAPIDYPVKSSYCFSVWVFQKLRFKNFLNVLNLTLD